jgi:hypothetical protein
MAAIGPYEEAAVLRTSGTDYTGIKADLTLPTQGSIPLAPVGERWKYYFNFYLGVADLCEAGVSFSRKTNANGSWHKFVNSASGGNAEEAGCHGGNTLKLQLTLDEAGVAKFLLNGNHVGSLRAGAGAADVKLCMAVCDYTGRATPAQVWYFLASFSNVQVRKGYGDKWAGPSAASWYSRRVAASARNSVLESNFDITNFQSFILDPNPLQLQFSRFLP